MNVTERVAVGQNLTALLGASSWTVQRGQRGNNEISNCAGSYGLGAGSQQSEQGRVLALKDETEPPQMLRIRLL